MNIKYNRYINTSDHINELRYLLRNTEELNKYHYLNNKKEELLFSWSTLKKEKENDVATEEALNYFRNHK